MDILYSKFEDAKEKRELKHETIIQNIYLDDEVELRENYKKNILFFQKKVDLSKIEENYDIWHEEANPDFFTVNFVDNGYEQKSILVEESYILIPKNSKEEILSLVISRLAGIPIILEKRDENYDVSLYFITNLYCEHEIKSGVMEYIFRYELHPECYVKEISNSSYKEFIEEYIKKNYLNKIYNFRISSSEDFEKYINLNKEFYCTPIERLIVSALKNKYKHIRKVKTGNLRSSKYEEKGYTVEYEFYNKSELVKADIINEEKECVGFVKTETVVTRLDVKIYYNGNLVDERKLKFIKNKKFKNTLKDYIDEGTILRF